MIEQQGALGFAARIDNSKLITDAEATKRALKGIGESGTKQAGAIEKAFNNAYSMAGMMAMGAVGSIGLLGSTILSITAKFEKFGVVLRNTLGNDAGDAALTMIAKFAAETPFQLDEVTAAFIKMANQGFVPTNAELVKLGDLASSTGKSFDQLAEAVLDAQTGQFERLKEFGIKASQNGDKVTFSFKEQKTTVDNTNASIQAYILSLGTLSGVAGANEKISASLTGQISNLGDKMDAMYNQIGTANKGIMYSAVGGAAALVENYETIAEAISVLIGIYGAYKLATMVVVHLEGVKAAALARNIAIETEYQALVAVRNIHMIAQARNVAVEVIAAQMRVRATQTVIAAELELAAATKAANASMLTNPYVLAAMAVAALGYGIYKLITLETDLEKSQKALNKTVRDSEKSIEAERMELDAMFSRLKAAKEGSDEYKEAKAAIFSKHGEHLKKLGDETTALNDVALAYETITKGALAAARARGLEKATREAADKASEVTAESKRKIHEMLVKQFGSQKGNDIYTIKILPVLDGQAQMTAEIAGIIREFEKTSASFTGGQFNTQVAQTTSNALDEEFKKVAAATAEFKRIEAQAKIEFAGAAAPASQAAKVFITAEEQRIELRKELVKQTKKLTELEKQKFEVGKDKAPLEAIEAQEAVIAGIKKQLGIKTEAAKQEKEDIKSTVQASKEYLAIQDQIINKTRELDAANAAKNTKRGLELAGEITGLQKQLTDLEKGKGITPIKARLNGGTDPKEQLKPMKQLTDEQRKQLDLAAKQATIDANAADLAEASTKRIQEQAQGFYQIADAAGFLAQQIGESNKGLAEMLAGVSNIANQMGSLVESGAFEKVTINSDGTKTGGMSQADAIGSAISGATQLVGMFVSQAAKNKAVMADYYASILRQQNQYNLSLNEQLRLNSQINGSVFFDDFRGKLTDASKALKDATEQKNKAMAEFYGSEAIVGKAKVISAENVLGGVGAGAALGAGIGTLILPGIGTAIGAGIGAIAGGIAGLFAKKKKDIVAPLLETYPGLIEANGKFNVELAKTLVANDQVTESTKAILENIIQWEEAAKAAREQTVAVIKDMAGSLGADLKNALVDAFEQGTDAAIKFGEAVTGVIEDILSQQIFNAIFGTALEKLQTDMEVSMGVGLDKNGNPITGAAVDGNWMDDIQRFIQGVPELTKVFNETMKGTQEMAKSGITYTREMTDEERRKKLELQRSVKMAEDNTNLLRLKMNAGKATQDMVDIAQENADNAQANLNNFIESLNFSVTTPGFDIFNPNDARTGSSKGLIGMTQDTGEELNGRFTAIQEHTYRMAEGIDILKSNSAGLLDNVIQIKGHTESMQGDMAAMKSDMGNVKAGIDTMNLKGIKIRS